MGQSRSGGTAVRRRKAAPDPGTGLEARGGAGGGMLPAAVGDFFICDLPMPAPKDDMASMEHPLFTLATQPDRRILRYEHGEATIEVTPSVKGLATIHDKDVLIFCISQLMAALNEGRAVAPTLQLCAHDLLVATRRDTSGDGYRRLREAFERLSGTRIVTNIATGGIETTRGFGLIDSWEIVRKARGGRWRRRCSSAPTTSWWPRGATPPAMATGASGRLSSGCRARGSSPTSPPAGWRPPAASG